ncbi:hypothetical protein [Alkalinema sp. FACHB-956]|uniref:hypothetical protein n=1 Tax=Alkalinema sp. FACHB-956 TaxID=2692768 RepID=UPI0016866C1F|nr:hypothetical protein [Alkalinema sp. FACHB-956]MBD2328339.1 hypothetical protein [Alkalinema sp. FACHB-956]
MSSHPKPHSQTANNVDGDVTQVGHDYIQNTQKSTQFNVVLLVFEIIALGGLALGVYMGVFPKSNNTPTAPANPSPTAIEQGK